MEKEGTYTWSEFADEWYGQFIICNECGAAFMVRAIEDDIYYCPRCGKKLKELDEKENQKFDF